MTVTSKPSGQANLSGVGAEAGTPQDQSLAGHRDQIKSRERVRDLAEVYTHRREVDAMLDLVPDMFERINTRFLEPACGDGNFLIEILSRKLQLINEEADGGTDHWYEFAALRAVASIYAIDINHENVLEAHERMRAVVDKEFADNGYEPTSTFRDALSVILNANVVQGDTLNDGQSIRFIEWEAAENEAFVRIHSFLEEPEQDLFYVAPEPLAPVHYSELTPEVLL